MKHLTYLLLSLLVLVSCKETSTNKADSENKESFNVLIDNEVVTVDRLLLPEEFKAKMASYEKYHLVDVRTPAELSENGTIEGSINIDFTDANFEEEINKLNKGIPIFIFCRSGGRSEKACALLNGYGFEDVYDLEGGYSAWLEKNKKSL